MGHPGAGLEWRRGGKPEVRGPSWRAWGPGQLIGARSGYVVGGGGPAVSWGQLGPCLPLACGWRRPFRLFLSWKLRWGQASCWWGLVVSQGVLSGPWQNYHVEGPASVQPSILLSVTPQAGVRLTEAPGLQGLGFWCPALGWHVGRAHFCALYIYCRRINSVW